MKPHWHPLATVYLKQPASVATPIMLRMLLAGEGRVELIYAGDSMWPTLRHGQSIFARQAPDGPLPEGAVLLVLRESIPDMLRLEREQGDGLVLSADADVETTLTLPRASLLAEMELPRTLPPSIASRRRHRLRLDLEEAWCGAVDEGVQSAESVRLKYDAQAGFYAGRGGVRLDPALLERVGAGCRPGGRVVVVGSGAGHECIALAKAGYETTGIEFAAAMVDRSRREAQAAGADVRFVHADVCRHREPCASVDLLLFTYDVYSFVPGRRRRIEMLRRMREWLAPGGSILLSARRVQHAYERAILSLQWLSALRRGTTAEWGDSHTRWLTTTGEIRRSFVRVFSIRQLRDECAEADLRAGDWRQGHQRLSLP